jgi:hypothetical protein
LTVGAGSAARAVHVVHVLARLYVSFNGRP